MKKIVKHSSRRSESVKVGMNPKIIVDQFVDFENTVKIKCGRLV